MGGRQRPGDALDAVRDDGVMEQITPRLLSWASVIDEQSLEQARRTAEMPFVFPHVALMPDAHPGLGATVGSVIPTDHAIIPAAVGVDIGCGMIAVLTQFRAEDLAGRPLRPLRQSIERAVPLSAGVANRRVVATAAPRGRRARVRGRSGRPRPSTALRQVARAAGHARLRQPLHRGEPRRAGPGVGLPALGLPGGGKQDRPAPHRGRPPARCSATGSTCPTGTSPTSSRAPRSSTPTSGTCAGPSTTRCSTVRR